MGFFDNLFDFDGNGKVTADEEFMAFNIFNECFGNDEDEEDLDFFDDFDDDF